MSDPDMLTPDPIRSTNRTPSPQPQPTSITMSTSQPPSRSTTPNPLFLNRLPTSRSQTPQTPQSPTTTIATGRFGGGGSRSTTPFRGASPNPTIMEQRIGPTRAQTALKAYKLPMWGVIGVVSGVIVSAGLLAAIYITKMQPEIGVTYNWKRVACQLESAVAVQHFCCNFTCPPSGCVSTNESITALPTCDTALSIAIANTSNIIPGTCSNPSSHSIATVGTESVVSSTTTSKTSTVVSADGNCQFPIDQFPPVCQNGSCISLSTTTTTSATLPPTQLCNVTCPTCYDSTFAFRLYDNVSPTFLQVPWLVTGDDSGGILKWMLISVPDSNANGNGEGGGRLVRITRKWNQTSVDQGWVSEFQKMVGINQRCFYDPADLTGSIQFELNYNLNISWLFIALSLVPLIILTVLLTISLSTFLYRPLFLHFTTKIYQRELLDHESQSVNAPHNRPSTPPPPSLPSFYIRAINLSDQISLFTILGVILPFCVIYPFLNANNLPTPIRKTVTILWCLCIIFGMSPIGVRMLRGIVALAGHTRTHYFSHQHSARTLLFSRSLYITLVSTMSGDPASARDGNVLTRGDEGSIYFICFGIPILALGIGPYIVREEYASVSLLYQLLTVVLCPVIGAIWIVVVCLPWVGVRKGLGKVAPLPNRRRRRRRRRGGDGGGGVGIDVGGQDGGQGNGGGGNIAAGIPVVNGVDEEIANGGVRQPEMQMQRAAVDLRGVTASPALSRGSGRSSRRNGARFGFDHSDVEMESAESGSESDPGEGDIDAQLRIGREGV
ncbi:hypothetical protein HDU76_004611 [Blyttiomyces sp. JEL0837]|nr:hypothetical protein HDU76_004611 [Blyttiomyces sp. JEL0837]